MLFQGEPGLVGPKGNTGEPGLQVPLLHFFQKNNIHNDNNLKRFSKIQFQISLHH